MDTTTSGVSRWLNGCKSEPLDEVEVLTINYTVTHPNLTPKQAVKGDAGYDLRSAIETVLDPGQTKLIPTGLALELPSNTFGMVCTKSGLALNNGIIVVNSPGIIDSGYRGEIKVVLRNTGDASYTVTQYSKVAQLLILTYGDTELTPVLQLGDTDRGTKGFGSTGVK